MAGTNNCEENALGHFKASQLHNYGLAIKPREFYASYDSA